MSLFDLLGYNDYKKIGSFKDVRGDNAALGNGPKQYGYSIATCSQSCRHYKYFALQDGSYCSCDDDFAKILKYGPKTCNNSSTGSENCNIVYLNKPPRPAGLWPTTQIVFLLILVSN